MSTTFGLPENVEDYQIMQEGTGTATRGIFSTGVATSVFVGQSPQLSFGSSLGTFLNYAAGSRDPTEATTSTQTLQLGLTFGTVVADTITFLKRGINLADGIQYTFSGCLRETVGGTARYLKLKNQLIGAGAFGAVGSGPVQAQVALVGNLSAYDGVSPVGWTFDTITTGALTGASGLADPVRIVDVDTGVTYKPSVRSWVVGFNNGIFPIPECGITTFADFIPTKRGINVQLSINKENLDIWNIHNLGHDTNVTIWIASPGTSFTATGGTLDPAAHSFAGDSPNIEAYAHNSLVGALS